jgi:hypothetical protein
MVRVSLQGQGKWPLRMDLRSELWYGFGGKKWLSALWKRPMRRGGSKSNMDGTQAEETL